MLLSLIPSWAKLAGVLAVAAGAAWASWSIRDAYAHKEKASAVEAVRASMQKSLDDERWLRSQFQRMVDDQLEGLLKAISNVKVEHTTITKEIADERGTHLDFYKQALPPGGYTQWKRARALVGASPASSPSP